MRKWNRRGQGAEEYTFINGIVLDEGKNELYVNSTPSKRYLFTICLAISNVV